jgi:predicted CoA-binding protein
MDTRANILTSPDDIAELIRSTKRIAVLGIKPDDHAMKPAHYVPKYMAEAGYEIIPVPVYYPEVTEILGKPVYRDLADVPGDIDMINVFRRSEDVHKHTLDIIARKPRSVWLQLGIRDDDFAQKVAEQGIKVVQDLCLMVEHRYLGR